MVDLHLHTCYSDGSDSVEELCKNLLENGITEFSITDHNTCAATHEILRINSNLGLKFLPGIEFSANYNKTEYHITAYGKKLLLPEIEKICYDSALARKHADFCFVHALLAEKDIEAPEYESHSSNRKGGWKSLNYLYDLGIIGSMRNFFELYDQYGQDPEFISIKSLLSLLRSIGIYSFLAHPPTHQVGDIMNEEVLNDFMNWGISGIEVYNSYYSDDKSLLFYKGLCRSKKLLTSGGSDYHGLVLNNKLGIPPIQKTDLELGPIEDEWIVL